jgi:phage-related minor tail protein
MEDDPLESAAAALQDFAAGPVTAATRSIETAIDRTFTAFEHSVARAVVSGKASFGDFVTSVLSDLDRLAANQYLTQPLEGLISQAVTAMLPLGGARASGGPVAAGSAYLVGEKGPELFVPGESGAITPNTALVTRQAITVNVTAPDAASFLKSESQIAAMLARALARGQRNL